MRKLLFFISLSLFAFADNYILEKGEIKAHTEVFGDNKINPKTQNIISKITNENNIESIRGEISISSLSLKSEKKNRDKNMYELLNTKLFPNIVFDITDIQKKDSKYEISGNLTLNSITKKITSKAEILEFRNGLTMDGFFSIKLTQFNIEPPTMFFLTVRDQIDIKYNLSYKKENK